jgi:MFS family permease
MGGAGGDEAPPQPGAGSARPKDEAPRRGFRGQFGATKTAAYRLAAAHLELARAELSEIVDEVKHVAMLLGIAVALAIFAAVLMSVGSSLFIGEWLFGSMGWGILHFTELCLAAALVAVLIALDVPAGHLARGLLVAAIVGVLVGVAAGFFVFNRLWEAIGVAVVPNLVPDTRPLVVGTAVGAGLGAVVGLLGGTETRGRSIGGIIGSAIAAIVFGAIAGAALGAVSAITFSWPVAVALGIAVMLGTWMALSGLEAARGGLDMEAWGRKFYPTQTIESAKETIEWVRERTPRGPKS